MQMSMMSMVLQCIVHTFTLLVTSQGVSVISDSILTAHPATTGLAHSLTSITNVKVKIFSSADCLDKNSPG